MLNISMAKLKNTLLPVPPISLQTHFAHIAQNIESPKAMVWRQAEQSFV